MVDLCTRGPRGPGGRPGTSEPGLNIVDFRTVRKLWYLFLEFCKHRPCRNNIGPKMLDFVGPEIVDFYKIDDSELDHDENLPIWEPKNKHLQEVIKQYAIV